MDWWVTVSEILLNLGLVVVAAVGLVLAAMRVLAANRHADAALRIHRFGGQGVRSRPRIVRPPGFVVDIHGAFIRRVDLSHASLERANLAGADATKASFRGANLEDATLTGTILKGADLREAKNVTVDQLREAIIDEDTMLPEHIQREDLARSVRG
jgi:hypothetical protein